MEVKVKSIVYPVLLAAICAVLAIVPGAAQETSEITPERGAALRDLDRYPLPREDWPESMKKFHHAMTGPFGHITYSKDMQFFFTTGINGIASQVNTYKSSSGARVYDEVIFGGGFKSKYFNSVGSISFSSDQKHWLAEEYFFGHYLLVDESYVEFHYEHASIGKFSLKGGRLIPRDRIDSPYSVFITSVEKPTPGLHFSYDGPFFFYETRWIQLTFNSRYSPEYLDPAQSDFDRNSGKKFPDKSVSYKSWGFKVGDFRFGAQDSMVYLERTFDAEYFFSPVPHYFGQLVTRASGAPWTVDHNDMSNMGIFIEWGKKGQYEVKGHFLIDDVNASFLPWIDVDNVSKAAWSFGGYYKFSWGKLGFWHGAALKHTYQATYTADIYKHAEDSVYKDLTVSPWSVQPYEYTFYPINEYMTDSGSRAVWVEDMYLGYKYGENAISFLVDYENTFFPGTIYSFHLYASVEYVVNGAKSPQNPWHQYTEPFDSISADAELLNDPVLEHRFILSARITKKFYEFTFFAGLQIGGIFNRLMLVNSPGEDYSGVGGADVQSEDMPKMYVPQEGEHLFVFNVTLGFRYDFQVLR